jgi:hypothetical protein
MKIRPGKTGLVILAIVIIIVFVAAIIAYQATGPMGIEERFNAAAGLRNDAEEESGGTGGFFIEGNAMLYALILVVLAAACVAMYRQFRL